jgi:hypothetical protein
MRNQDPGLPGDIGIDNRKKRAAMQFTLPQSIAAQRCWKMSGLPEKDLTFVLAEATVADEEAARKFAKGDNVKMVERLQDLCTIMIGGEYVHMSHSRLTTWQDAIGVKGRKLVEGKWLENYQVTGEEAAELDATGKEVTV